MLVSPFWKFIKKLVVFVTVIVILDILSGIIFHFLLKNQSDGRLYKISYSLDKSNEDIIILGSSRAESNYDPAAFKSVLGLSCWNSGRGGQSILYFLAIEQEILKRYSPKMIILNMDPIGLENPIDYDKAAVLRPFVKDHPEIYTLLSKKDNYEKYKLISNMYLYNSALFYLIRPYILKNKDGQLNEKGWKPRKGIVSPLIVAQQKELIKNTAINNKLDSLKLQYFDQMIDKANEKNVKLIVCFSPDYFPNVSETPTMAYVKKLSRPKNFSVFDFTRDSRITEKPGYFFDTQHTNREGAIFFSRIFAEELAKTNN